MNDAGSYDLGRKRFVFWAWVGFMQAGFAKKMIGS